MKFFDIKVVGFERIFEDTVEYLIEGWDEEIYVGVVAEGSMLRIKVYDLEENHFLGPVEIPAPPGAAVSEPDKLCRALGLVIPALVQAWVREVEDGDMVEVETDEIFGHIFRTWKPRAGR
ncbi:MAG: hypothetical protein J5I35_12330 [Methanothrix harundinacea]|nr:hypothetical protein [Methanothrix harundinacea]